MKVRDDVEQCLNDLGKKICDCRLGISYISNDYDPYDDTEKSKEQIYSSGVCEGIYKGLEMALGLLETVEDRWEDKDDL